MHLRAVARRLTLAAVHPTRSTLAWLLFASVFFGNATLLLAQEMAVPLYSSIDVSALPSPRADLSGTPATKFKRFLTPDPEGLQAWRDFILENPDELAAAPGLLRDVPNGSSVALTAPTASVQFEGLANVDNAALRGFGVLPPDDGLAVGPNDVFQMVNVVGRITTKSGASPTSFGLNSFFGVAAGFGESDPRVIYDASSGRWFGSYVQFSSSAASSSILLAVSATSDPRGTFCVYRIGNPTSETFLQDFPMLGVSDDKVVVSYNGFALPSESFIGAGYYVVNKGDLTACAATVRTVRAAPNPFRVSMHPSQSLSSTSNLYMAMHAGGSSLTLVAVSGLPGVSPVTETSTSLTIRSWSPPPSAQQAGSAVLLDTGDDRVLSVAWRNNSLWLSGNEACIPAGDTAVRSCLRLIELRTDSSSVNQDMTFGTNGEYYSYPALRPDSGDNVYVVFTRSSSTAFASVRVTGRLATDPLNTLQASTEIRSGGGAQTNSTSRMGDYSAAAVDPSVAGTVWVVAEYIRSTANADWGTYIGKLSFGAPPPASISVSPTSVVSGGSVTATWSNIPSPSTTDWIGLYSPGSADTAFLAWIYVSCSKTATTAKASGSCPFVLPNPLASGTYELRLLANNGFSRLATSNAFSVTTANTAPTAPTTLGQFRTDALTAIAVGGTTPETSVVLKGTVSDPDAGQTVKLQLEVRPLATAFSNTATHESALLASGSVASVSVPSLTPGASYHWQARAVDNQGAASAWTPFGGNAETGADFVVAAGSVTLSVSPTSATPGATITATWSGIPSPSATDWIGLYTPGSADTAFLTWIYVSCSRATLTGPTPSGSCPFALPNSLASGTYELRLYANNGFSRLATGNTFTVTSTNTAPATPTTLGQFRTDALTAIAIGGTTPETSVILKGALGDPDAGQTVKLQLEVRPLATAFSNTVTHESALLASGSLAAVTVPSLTPGTSYHWQARAVDSQGAASAWTPFGANLESAPDFAVSSSSTTLSVSPTSAAPGSTVTATWSGIATPTPMDWIGLYAAGAPDTAFLAWTYLSCSKATTAVRASGSCPFVLPNPLASGIYELRLLANNGFTRLATSGPLIVP